MLIEGIASTARPDLYGDVTLPAMLADAVQRKGVENVRFLLRHDEARSAGRLRSALMTPAGLRVIAELDHRQPGVAAEIVAIRQRQPRGFSLGYTGFRIGRFVAPMDLLEISLVLTPGCPDCLVRPCPWPEDMIELFARQDAAAAKAPPFTMPAIRYPEEAR